MTDSLSEASAALLADVVRRAGGVRRPQQEEMLTAVAQALTDETNLLVQAGTGVGKSLAYLIPLLLRSVEEESGQLISTSSLALQRQIISQDGPLVQEALAETAGVEVDLQLLKGWSNYLCRYRLSGGLQEEFLWEDRQSAKAGEAEVARLQDWSNETETGDRDDVDFPVSASAWRQVSVSKRECLGSGCPYVEDCLPAQARERAFGADVVVTNHSLLGIYVNGRPEVLPEFSALVVDEAHDLVSRVRNQGTEQLSGGQIGTVARAVRPLSTSAAASLERVRDRLETELDQLRPGLLSLRPDSLRGALSELDQALQEAKSELGNKTGGAKQQEQAHLARARMEGLAAAVESWGADPAETITWVGTTLNGSAQLNLAPLHVSQLLGQRLFSAQPSILTSATLTAGGTFEPARWQSGIGLASRAHEAVDVGTSFTPEQQGILYLATHLSEPTPTGRGDEFYTELVELVEAAGGGMLGLFSSTQGVLEAAEYLRAHTDLEILVQGEDSLPALVRSFSASVNACLLGTMSLWQGVDVPGLTCRLVVIDRIPFPRPNDPIVQAQSRAAAAAGRNPFYEVSVVPAATMLAQGAGRLLRSSSDQGVIALLDSRIGSRSYGGFLRKSLPPFWTTTDPQIVRDALRRLGARANEREKKDADS